MGAWGHRNFENDGALDFVWEINEGGVQTIREAINKVVNTPDADYLESPVCTEALAAIEYVAAAKGKPSEDFPEESEIWLEKNGGKELLSIDGSILLKAIERIKSSSELREQWDESDDAKEWYNILSGLEQRLS
jgi:hypothetical protein